jgi:hypothetical protein
MGGSARLGDLSEEQLASLAERLAQEGSADAEQALERLSAGDRDGALAALREALARDDPRVRAEAGGGGGEAGAAGPSGGGRPVWTSGHWPLRYDRTVRRWFDRQARLQGGHSSSGENE